jgi:hypothetical protein
LFDSGLEVGAVDEDLEIEEQDDDTETEFLIDEETEDICKVKIEGIDYFG